MDANRFDTIAKRFAGRRLSRRKALRQGGAGLAAGALAAAGLARPAAARAQAATPAASPAAVVNLEWLFVQVFESGTFRPKEGEPGVYVLAFKHSSAQTIFFSNRPARVVGTVPTARMTPYGGTFTDPLNAALVTRAADGAEDVLVVELLSPTYDEAAGTLSYDVRVLENYQEEGLRFVADKQGDSTIPESFGQASLFIDDCPSGQVLCVDENCEYAGSWDNVPMCGDENYCCGPCESADERYWADKCKQTFATCSNRGGCSAMVANVPAGCFGGCTP